VEVVFLLEDPAVFDEDDAAEPLFFVAEFVAEAFVLEAPAWLADFVELGFELVFGFALWLLVWSAGLSSAGFDCVAVDCVEVDWDFAIADGCAPTQIRKAIPARTSTTKRRT
jgi:hypothetical protein